MSLHYPWDLQQLMNWIILLFQKFPAPAVVPVAMPCPPPVYTPPSRPAPASKSQQDSQLQLQAQPVSVDSIYRGKYSLATMVRAASINTLTFIGVFPVK
jgi:hypothetical protein